MIKQSNEWSPLSVLELQTLKTGKGGHPGNDRETPQEPATTQDDWYDPADGFPTLNVSHARFIT